MLETFVGWLELTFALIGVAVLSYGVIDSAIRWLIKLAKRQEIHLSNAGEETIRTHLGTYILLSLEFFIAADLLRTVLYPSWEEIGLLGAIVAIRTILSMFLNMEIKFFK